MLYSWSARGVGSRSVCWWDEPVARCRHADQLGDLAWGELAWGEQAGVGDVVVVAQVRGGVGVEGAPGAGGVPGLVERGGQGGVVQGRADAAGQPDGGRVGVAQLDGVLAAGGLQLLGGA